MTDPQPAPADDDEAPGFHIVPDAELYLRLERQVRQLAQQPDLGQLREDLAAVQRRLDRHRDELELVKRRFGELVDLVRANLPVSPAPTPNRNLL